jgi:tRNA U34 5-methylaminomethyl-2-thiouridine-forming methyltransferase MnmC
MNKKEVVITSDGSSSLFLPEWNESYHSKHGAIQEAKHVFIDNSFSLSLKNPLHIMEIGFGTGLNALLTLYECHNTNKIVYYTGVEAYPVSTEILHALNYSQLIEKEKDNKYFEKLHQTEWAGFYEIDSSFHLQKRKQFFDQIDDIEAFDIIYFDAFGFRVQPELWSENMFLKMFRALKNEGILVTYACRTPIKKAMEAAGFHTEKLPGPPGKREMLRAIKLS